MSSSANHVSGNWCSLFVHEWDIYIYNIYVLCQPTYGASTRTTTHHPVRSMEVPYVTGIEFLPVSSLVNVGSCNSFTLVEHHSTITPGSQIHADGGVLSYHSSSSSATRITVITFYRKANVPSNRFMRSCHYPSIYRQTLMTI